MATTVTVYTTPACMQCKATYRALDTENIDYTVVDVTTDTAAHQRVTGLGHQQVPVVVIDHDSGEITHWSGFRRDRIAATSALLGTSSERRVG